VIYEEGEKFIVAKNEELVGVEPLQQLKPGDEEWEKVLIYINTLTIPLDALRAEHLTNRINKLKDTTFWQKHRSVEKLEIIRDFRIAMRENQANGEESEITDEELNERLSDIHQAGNFYTE